MSITIEPDGKKNCPICGGQFQNIELLCVHFSCVTACVRSLVEDDRIQLLSENDLLKRLILTDSIHLVIHKMTGRKRYVVTLKAISVLGEFVDVATWNDPWHGRAELASRLVVQGRQGAIRGLK